jgi:selenocysteine-specific elongation factor
MHHVVIGTAGHIDHGKSAMVLQLTGTDPDRLKEEKEREITIDLGFAFLGENITFLDVPGHEKFVKNMAAGVSTIDLVLLVVAADDGVMPQTCEHFDIVRLLGVRKGIIVVTKIDLVDQDWLDLVMEDIKELVKGSFLEEAPIACISNASGQGIEELRQLILKQAEVIEARQDKGLFSMWIDRVFTIKGSGTVVAGTILSGKCKSGDTVELLPAQKSLRVRRVQVHNKSLEQCIIGERAAINLMDINKSEIVRGNMLAQPGYYIPTYMMNARLQLLKSTANPLKNRTRIRLHLGTGELIARVVTLEKEDLHPGQSAVVQLRLESPGIAEIGHRFIIRSFSPAITIGGGTILDPHPPKLKYLPKDEIENISRLENADPLVIIEQSLLKNTYDLKSASMLAKEFSLDPQIVRSALDKLIDQKRIMLIKDKPEKAVIHIANYDKAQGTVIEFMEKFHRENPVLWGIKKSELKEKIFGDINVSLLDAILNPLQENKQIVLNVERIKLYDHEIVLNDKQNKLREQIEKVYLEHEFVTPGWDEIVKLIAGNAKEITDVVTALIEKGVLIEVKYYEKPALYHQDCINRAKKILIDYLKVHNEIRLGEYREMINSTRKCATPIMVYFDRLGVTERHGEIRILAK